MELSCFICLYNLAANRRVWRFAAFVALRSVRPGSTLITQKSCWKRLVKQVGTTGAAHGPAQGWHAQHTRPFSLLHWFSAGVFCTCVNWVLPLPQSWTTFRWVVAKGKWQELLSSMHFSRSSKNDLSCVSKNDLRKNMWLGSQMAMYEAKQSIFSVFMLTVFVYWLLHLFSYKYDIY